MARAFWKVLNPITRGLAGFAPCWVLLETRGCRSGKRRRTPFATGPFDGRQLLLIAVHGEHSGFAHNIGADPHVRVKRRGRWRDGTATFRAIDEATLSRFGRYARSGLRTFAADPMVLQIDFKSPEGVGVGHP
jgi:deazaflavin-dependent oxidoreductase (nitroreductase family)